MRIAGVDVGLPEPEFRLTDGFVVTIRRPVRTLPGTELTQPQSGYGQVTDPVTDLVTDPVTPPVAELDTVETAVRKAVLEGQEV